MIIDKRHYHGENPNASHSGVLNSLLDVSGNLLRWVDVLQQTEKRFNAVLDVGEFVFFKFWILGPIYLVAEGAVFKNDFHDFFPVS